MPLPLELGQVGDAHARRALEQISLQWRYEPLSIMRADGSPGLALAASAWTSVPVTIAAANGPAALAPADAPYSGALRVLKGGVYSLSANVIFSPLQQTGERALRIVALRGALTGDIVSGGPTVKALPLPMVVSGMAYLFVDDVIGLQVYSDTATSIYSAAGSAWLVATRIGS